SVKVVSPEWTWVTLKTAPPNVPVCVLWPVPVDVIRFSVPCSVSITAPDGICLSWVRGTSLPLISIRTRPWVGLMLNDLATVGAPGAGAGGGGVGRIGTERRACAVGRDKPDVVER